LRSAREERAREAGALVRRLRLGRFEVRLRSWCGAVAAAVAVLLLSRSNIPFVPDRVALLSRVAVLLLSRFAVSSWYLLRSHSLSNHPQTDKEKTAE
jgi:hypothetical protein